MAVDGFAALQPERDLRDATALLAGIAELLGRGRTPAIGAGDGGGAVGGRVLVEQRQVLARRNDDHTQVHHHRQDRADRRFVAAVRRTRGAERGAYFVTEEMAVPWP